MGFYGRSFLYDNIPSETFGLYISSIDSDAINKSMGSSSMEILEQKIYRKATPYFYGATPSPRLSFDFSAYSDNEIDAETYQLIQKWLFSSRDYKILQIDQVDIRDIYFNCIMNEPKIVRIGSIIHGFTCNVQCNSPFAWKFPTTVTYSYTNPVIDNTVTFNNTSDDTGDYLFPNLVITMNNFGGGITITNLDDNNRVFSFVTLSPNEVITMNCSLETLTSSTGLKRLSNFNKHFLRLVPGVNRLRIQGEVASVQMTTQFVAKKISG